MKKLLGLLSVAIVAACTTAIAQPPAGGGRMDPAAMKERQVKMLKESDLKLTDVQIDSVIAINMESAMAMRGMRDLSPEERQTKMKTANEARDKRFATALKDEALAKKVSEFYEKQRQQRMQGGGGGQRPGGN